MRQLSWKIFAFRQAIVLSNCQATAKVNIRFGSTGSGVSALFGPIVDRMKSRLWTTIRGLLETKKNVLLQRRYSQWLIFLLRCILVKFWTSCTLGPLR